MGGFYMHLAKSLSSGHATLTPTCALLRPWRRLHGNAGDYRPLITLLL